MRYSTFLLLLGAQTNQNRKHIANAVDSKDEVVPLTVENLALHARDVLGSLPTHNAVGDLVRSSHTFVKAPAVLRPEKLLY